MSQSRRGVVGGAQTLLTLLHPDFKGIEQDYPCHAAQLAILEREAQQLHANGHANIIEVVGMVDDMPPPCSPYVSCTWMMMDTTELGSLDQWIADLRRQRSAGGVGDSAGDLLPLSQLLQLFVDALSGVAHLHAAVPPLMHRDVTLTSTLVHRRSSVPVAPADSNRCVGPRARCCCCCCCCCCCRNFGEADVFRLSG
jgi:serine/threonine protein kinase